MKKTAVLLVASSVAVMVSGLFGGVPAFASAPGPGATRCSPAPPPGTTHIGDLTAPNPNIPCFLNQVTIVGDLYVNSFVDVEFSTITGRVTVGDRGRLVLGHSEVDGAVIGAHAKSILLDSSTVAQGVRSTSSTFGTFQVCGSTITGGLVDSGVTDPFNTTTIGDPSNGCAGNTIKGELTLSGNRGPAIVKGNVVGAISVTANTSTTPSVLSDNTIKRSLDCSGNAVDPTGANNSAPTKTGQCAGL